MKFSCAIFFFVLTIAAQFEHIQTTVSDELVQFKRTLDDASNALQDAEESPALSGNPELQRQRRKSIDDLLNNSELDLNLNLEREALDLKDDVMHPLQLRATKIDIKNNNEDSTKKSKINDQLNELVHANSRFQNLHRQLLNSFHNSNTNLKIDDVLQKSKANKDSKSSSNSNTNSGADKVTKVDKEKIANKDKDTNDYGNSFKTSSNKNANNKNSYISNFNWKSNLGGKDNFNIDMDFGKDGSVGAPYSQSFSKFDSSDSLNANSNLNSGRKDTGMGSSVLTKAYISCKPISGNAGHRNTDNTYLEFASNLQEPQPNKASNTKSNLNSILLLEANSYRNALNAKKMQEEDNLEELNEKKVDPEMHRMLQKVDFPHFKLDFDSSMEDFVQKSKSDSADDEEPISYEKTIENIHFPSIVNDQFDLGRNDLSHEANYKLSKIEQEQSEPRKGNTRAGDSNDATQGLDEKLKVAWKRSSGFNPMDEIKLKTSTRLMAKGLGPSLPSYALSETQRELQLDDAVNKLEKNLNIDSANGQNENDRHGSLVSQDILDWQERLKRLEDIEERSYEQLIYDGSPEHSKDESDQKSKTHNAILGPGYSVLRKRRIDGQPSDDASNLLDLLRTKRVFKNQCEDDRVLSQNLDTNSPDDFLQFPDLTPLGNDKLLADVVPAPEVAIPEIPTDEYSMPLASISDKFEPKKFNELDGAQMRDEDPIQPEDNVMADIYKRCGDQESNEKKDQREMDADVRHETTIFKFKRDTSRDDNVNGPKRRVKRIGVLNDAGEMSGVREIDLGGLSDLMTINQLKPKREIGEKTTQTADQGKSDGSLNQEERLIDKKFSGQKVLRRRRRELPLTQKEVFNDDSLHVLSSTNRMRRSLGRKSRHLVRRETEKAQQNAKENAEREEKEKTSQVDGARKNKQNENEKNNANKLTRSEVREANNTEHTMGKRAAMDDIEDNNSDNRKLKDTAMLLSYSGNSIPDERYIVHSERQRIESLMKFDDKNSDNRNFIDPVRRFAESGRSIPGSSAARRRESLIKQDNGNIDGRKFRDSPMIFADNTYSIPDNSVVQSPESLRKLEDNNSDNRKFSEPGMPLEDSRYSMTGSSTAQRRESLRKLDESNSDNRKFRDAAMLSADSRDSIPVGKFTGYSAHQRIEPLTDAAVIAADRRAMNAARAAYARNAERDDGGNGDARQDDYTDLMARLRRLSLRNREREKERERENDFGNSVSEFGDQQFDNLKQADQYVRSFDGVPADNLWYGSDPWEEDNNNNNPQQLDLPKSEENSNKNQPNQQRKALTIKIENGAIKSIERKDESSKDNEASVTNDKTGNEEEEDDGNSESAPFGWFGKGKTKTNSEKSDKCADDGLVLKLNDQILNCTAFNTLEGFLKSVQQHQQNRDDSNRSAGQNSNTGGSGNAIGKNISGHCVGQGDHGGGKQGSDGQGSTKQGTSGHDNGGHEEVGSGGNGQRTGGHAGGGHSGGGECEGDGQKKSGHGAGGHGGGGPGDHGRFGAGRNGMGNDKKVGSGSGDGSGGGGDGAGSGNGLGPAGGNYGSTGPDGNSNNNSKSEAINMTVAIQPVTLRPQGSCGSKSMKLNITINASVMGDQKAKNFFGNGTIKVQSEDRERRGISFPQFAQIKRYATKRKCTKPKTRCNEGSPSGKGAMEIVKSVFNMAKCNPQMKPLWASLKHNQQCMKKAPPQEMGFEKMQKDDVNHIEDMVEQAMEAISDIIEDQVEQRSCIPLPPELKIFYEQILEVFESNSAEGVREKRAYYDTPFDEFSKEVRLIDPNGVEERSRIVKKLLRQYDDLPAEEQQQMVGVREDLLQNLGFLESIKAEQPQKRREQPNRPVQIQQPEQELTNEPVQPQLYIPDNVKQSDTDIQARRRRELLKQLEDEKDEDQQVLKVFNLPYTPEYLRLLKASELLQEQEIRDSERNEANGESALLRQ